MTELGSKGTDVGANEKHAATFHPMYPCETCSAVYSTRSAAETCSEQDEIEDRDTRRFYRSNN